MKSTSSLTPAALFNQSFKLNRVDEGIEFPDVENTEIFGNEPYNDKYRIHKLKSDFYCYDKRFLTEIWY